MDKVVLFDNKQGEYGIYDKVSDIMFVRLGREIYDTHCIIIEFI